MNTPPDSTEFPFLNNVVAGVRELHAYEPGMPVEELQRRLGLADVVKLASNENPLGPSDAVKAAIAGAAQTNMALYPDDGGFSLKAKLADLHGVGTNQITLTNGSNVVLSLVGNVFLGPDRAAMYGEHAFACYPLVAQAQSAPAVVVPSLPPDHPSQPYGTDLEGFIRMMRDDVAVIFIATPNNPTGTWNTPDEIGALMARVPPHVIVVLDEAYYEFQEPQLRPHSAELLKRYPNLIVTRTFSKVYGLAALRIGYGVAHPKVTDLLHRVRAPFNNNTLALVAAEAALGDQAHVSRCAIANAHERHRVADALRAMGLKILPSQANFLAIDFGRPTGPIHQALLERGVIVRPMGSYHMPNFLRVSIGTEKENDWFLAALKKVLAL
jgi:histidinol-phosphate aminotransferase